MKRKRQVALSPVLRFSWFMSVMEAVWRVLLQCTVSVCVCVCVCERERERESNTNASISVVTTKL